MPEITKAYNPREVEDKIYKKWEESGKFNPDNLDLPKDKKDDKENRFVISMPPPNATGVLHLGHASMLAYQDLMARYNRMNGRRVLWLPGTDHAAIATQTKVEKIIAKEGKTKYDLGREKFIKRVEEYIENSRSVIKNQTKKMGSSCDWSRERYTLDEGLSRAVKEVFVKMYNDGLIYRGHRIVNWCPRCESTLADDEVEYKEEKIPFYYFKYGPIIIGTARPETKFADKIIVVHPDDERYKYLIGKTFTVPWIEGDVEARVVADKSVDKDFGTGAMTITPAHDFEDFQLAQKHGIEIVKIIDEKGNLTKFAGSFAGMNANKARDAIVKKMKQKGLVDHIDENYIHNLSICYRCDTPIEPLPSLQWFIDVDKKITIKGNKYFQNKSIKDVALEVVKNGEIKIIPERFEKTYFNWMENLHDWCISRQIWFGHRIPVYYKLKTKNEKLKTENPNSKLNDEIYVGVESPKGEDWVQDSDTLDTWFSSGLWTFSTLLDQDHKKYKTFEEWVENSPDLKNFHPTSVMETGYDILFFWVARMILMTTYAVGEIPFETVYLHGMVKDKLGRKMSKSLGNGIDPVKMIEKYGTDALRLSMIVGSSPGNDIKLYEEKIEGYRNFVNKLWNISRFIISNLKSETGKLEIRKEAKLPMGSLASENVLTLTDKWILEHLENLKYIVNNAIENYQFSSAVDGENGIRDFMRDKFADWYLEISKAQGKNDAVLIYVLETLLKLCHPFIPFVTEQIWKETGKEKLLMVEEWPKDKGGMESTQTSFGIIQEIIKGIRSIKNENGIALKDKVDIIINFKIRKDLTQKDFDAIKENKNIIESLAGVKNIKIESNAKKPEGWIQFDYRASVYVNIGGSINKEKETRRVQKEIEELKKYVAQISAKLSNKQFISNAPVEIVNKEKEKLAESEKKLEKLKEKLSNQRTL